MHMRLNMSCPLMSAQCAVLPSKFLTMSSRNIELHFADVHMNSSRGIAYCYSWGLWYFLWYQPM